MNNLQLALLTWAVLESLALVAVLRAFAFLCTTEQPMSSDHMNYWRRAFRSHDEHTQVLHREIDRAIEGPHDWADSAIVHAILGTPAANQDAIAKCRQHKRESRITRWLLGAAAVLVVAILLAGCGGGSEPLEGNDDKSADPATKTTLPIDCGIGRSTTCPK